MPEVLQQMLNYVIAIYIRLSAEDGDLSDEKNESNSVVNQRAYIRRFIELRPEFAGAQILEFCDDGYSGTNMERPAVRRLLEQVRQRKINCIIVKDMSRFGRDYIVPGCTRSQETITIWNRFSLSWTCDLSPSMIPTTARITSTVLRA